MKSKMQAFPISLNCQRLLLYGDGEAAASACCICAYPSLSPPLSPATARIRNPILFSPPPPTTAVPSPLASSKHSLFKCFRLPPSSSIDEDEDEDDDVDGDGDGDGASYTDDDERPCLSGTQYRGGDGGIEIEIEKIGKNCRRIRSKISVQASLQTVWNILTDYERLADIIPGLSVSQLLEKRDNFARLFQIGQQNLGFGLKFNAKGILDCYEKDLESIPSGQRRDIEFKMIEGDFQIFQGKWSIEQVVQCSTGRCEQSDSLFSQEFRTTLSYAVDVEPKLLLPVRLVEGRICREIKRNLSCIREEAHKASYNTLPDH